MRVSGNEGINEGNNGKPYVDFIHSDRSFIGKYDAERGETVVQPVELEKPYYQKIDRFIPLAGIVRIHRGERVIDVGVYYPFSKFLAVPLGEGVERRDKTASYEKKLDESILKEPVQEGALTPEKIKKLYGAIKEDAKEDEDAKKLLDALGEDFETLSAEEQVEKLKEVAKTHSAELKAYKKQFGIKEFELSKPIGEVIFEALSGNKQEIEFIPLAGIVVGGGLSGKYEYDMVFVSVIPEGARSDYLGKKVKGDIDFRIRASVLGMFHPYTVRAIEQNKLSERAREIMADKLSALMERAKDEGLKNNLAKLANALRNNEFGPVEKLIVNKISRQFRDTLANLLSQDDGRPFRFELKKGADEEGKTTHYFLAENSKFATSPLFLQTLMEMSRKGDAVMLALPTPALSMKDKNDENYSKIKEYLIPVAVARIEQNKKGKAEVKDLVVDNYAFSNFWKGYGAVYIPLRFALEKATSEKQLKALALDGLGKITGLGKFIQEASSRFLPYKKKAEIIQELLLEAKSPEELKQKLPEDVKEFYEKGLKFSKLYRALLMMKENKNELMKTQLEKAYQIITEKIEKAEELPEEFKEEIIRGKVLSAKIENVAFGRNPFRLTEEDRKKLEEIKQKQVAYKKQAEEIKQLLEIDNPLEEALQNPLPLDRESTEANLKGPDYSNIEQDLLL